MRRYLTLGALMLCVAAGPALVGCEKTTEEHKVETKKPDGATVTEQSKTVQSPDGSTKKTSEQTVTH